MISARYCHYRQALPKSSSDLDCYVQDPILTRIRPVIAIAVAVMLSYRAGTLQLYTTGLECTLRLRAMRKYILCKAAVTLLGYDFDPGPLTLLPAFFTTSPMPYLA